MKRLFSFTWICLTALFVCVQAPSTLQAQEPHSSELYKAMQARDSLLFKVVFNTCDTRPLDMLLSENFEFYHDQGGITNGKAAFIETIKNNICKLNYKATRELVEGSLEVYPLHKDGVLYGAIQMGEHRFFATEPGKAPYFTSIAKFTHLWLLENGDWKFQRGLSYDHQSVNRTDKEDAIFDNDAAIEKWLQENNIHTLGIGIIEGGQLQQVKLFGELKKGNAAPYNTIFNVASLAKTITNLVTLKLVSSGQWKLDEPLDKYWVDPDLAKDPRHHQLTTRIILSQRSGFPNWRFMNKTGKLTFEFDPGTKYQYSGEGFEYLRHALESKFHKPLEKLADSLLFKPLGMTDSRFIWDEAKVASRFAIGYNAKNEAYENNRNTKANAADDLLTTIEDYGKFLVSVINGAGLSGNVYGEMVKHQTTVKENKYFGLGWEIYDLGNGEYALAHGGGDKGVATEAIILPGSKKGLIIFTNADEGYKVYEKLMRHYLGDGGDKIFAIEMGK
jgi:CubicO group peptidase (beta-lactamase class C family)